MRQGFAGSDLGCCHWVLGLLYSWLIILADDVRILLLFLCKLLGHVLFSFIILLPFLLLFHNSTHKH